MLLAAYLRVTSFITNKNPFTSPSHFPRESVINESASPVLLDTPTPRFPLYQHGSQKSVFATSKNSVLSKNKVYSGRELVLHSFPFLLNKFYVTLSYPTLSSSRSLCIDKCTLLKIKCKQLNTKEGEAC
jgi:hypothetical protein